MLKLTTLIVCSVLVLSSCGKKDETTAQNAEATKPATEATTTTASATTPAKYKMKSGIVTSEMDNMIGGGKIKSVLYFDDYGAKEATETSSETTMMGTTIKTHNIEINRDGYQYKLDLEKKTGTKFKMPNMPSAGGTAMFASLSDADLASDMMKEWNVKKEAPITVAGKQCDVYSMDNKQRQMKGTVASYQGIPMKVDQTMAGMKIKSEVVKFEENATVPPGIFDVPADVKVEEVK